MTTHFTVQSIEGDDVILAGADGSSLRCPKAALPAGISVAADVWLTTDKPADPRSILNEALGTNHGPS